MKNTGIVCLAAALLAPCRLYSGNGNEWDSVLERLASSYGEDLDPGRTVLLLEELHDNPLNINRASPQQLMSLPFLSDGDVEEISAYIYFHGPMLSMGELQLVPGLDYDKRQLLRQFVYIGPGPDEHGGIRLKDVFRYGKLEAVQGADIPLYTREGYREHPAEVLRRYPNREYLGTRVGHSLRLSFNWNSRIRFGLTAQKDAGEPFFEKRPAGYDFYSPYLFLQDTGPLKTIALGRYKVSTGCGLLMGSGFGIGPGPDAATRTGVSVRPHSSCSETGYLTGTAVQWGKKVGVTAFASSQLTDASTASDGSISSFKTDGYHRTPLEFSRKHNCRQNTAGAAIQYDRQGTAIGAAVLAEHFSRRLADGDGTLYGLSADFAIRRPRFSIWGETAANVRNGAVATLDNLLLRLPGHYDLTLSLRWYSPQYESLHSSGMSQSEVRNEYGFMASVKRGTGRLKTDCFIDVFGHQQPRYQASLPSHGLQIRSTASCNRLFDGTLKASLNFKAVQKDCAGTGGLEYMRTTRFKLGHETGGADGWSAKGQLMLNLSTFPGKGRSWGKAVNGQVRYSMSHNDGKGLDIYVSGCLFSTDSYDSAVNIYENGPKYGFGFMTLSGKGCRMAAMIKVGFRCGLELVMKTGSTAYFDRDSMGSGAAKLDSSHREDVGIQAIWKFQATEFLN